MLTCVITDMVQPDGVNDVFTAWSQAEPMQ